MGTITIDDARELLYKAKQQAGQIYAAEDRMALDAIEYVFALADTELLKLQKVPDAEGQEQDADRIDAARYRWLRDPANIEGPSLVAAHSSEPLDAAIDEAMANENDSQ